MGTISLYAGEKEDASMTTEELCIGDHILMPNEGVMDIWLITSTFAYTRRGMDMVSLDLLGPRTTRIHCLKDQQWNTSSLYEWENRDAA
jgi:hypothetical protein